MQVRSTWIMELSELSAMTKAALERTKAFITRKHDRSAALRPTSYRGAPPEHLHRNHQ